MSQKFTCTFNFTRFGLNAMSFVGELEKCWRVDAWSFQVDVVEDPERFEHCCIKFWNSLVISHCSILLSQAAFPMSILLELK